MTEQLASSAPSMTDRTRRRLAALAETGLLGSGPEQEFDTVVRLAQRALQCKIALVSLVDLNRQWFKAKCGLSVDETPIEQSFCAHAVEAEDVLIVPDARADPRFADNPLVIGPPFIRFYIGIPVRTSGLDGRLGRTSIGTLCVIDDKPRQISIEEIDTLRDLAGLVETCIAARIWAANAGRLAAERQTHVQRLDREQRQFRQAERMANIGSWRIDLADRSIAWSSQVFAIHDLSGGTPPPMDAAMEFYPPLSRPLISDAVERAIAGGQAFDVETDLITAKGTQKRVRVMGEVELVDGRAVALIGVVQDITIQHRMESLLRRTATMDDLTQIANRAGCTEAIEQSFAAGRAQDARHALMLVDLDGFKAVNDLFGHLTGDALLQTVGARLRAPYLSDCFVGRLGGDEFVLIASSRKDCDNLGRLVQRLLIDLRQTVRVDGRAVSVSGTIGISWLNEDVEDRCDWLRRADLALYEAKRERRGTAKTFGQPGLTEGAPTRARLRAVGR